MSKRRLAERCRLPWAHRELAERSGVWILQAGSEGLHRGKCTRVRSRAESGASRREQAALPYEVTLLQQCGVDVRFLVHRAPKTRERPLLLIMAL